MLPEQDRYYMTRSELLARVTTLLAGRVAEEVVLNEISTGAQNDLERATSIVRQMIMEYGMSEKLGPITLGRRQHEQVFLGRDITRDRDYSEDIARSIDEEIRRVIDECYTKAEEIIVNNRAKLELLAQALREQETVDAEEISWLMEGKTLEEIRHLRDSAKASETEETAAENIQEAKEENEDYRGSELPLKKGSVQLMIKVNDKKNRLA